MTGTLGSLISDGYSVTAYCNTCNHRAEIDLEAMALIYGKAAPVRGSVDRGPARIGRSALRCGVATCRSRNTSIRIAPAGLPSGRL